MKQLYKLISNKRFLVLLVLLMVFSYTVPTYAATYLYDDANRLTTVIYDNGVQMQYTYDNAGNRLTARKTGVGNLLKNPGFEKYTGANGIADHWTSNASSGVQAVFNVVNSPIHSGAKAQKITATALTQGKSVALYQKIPVQPYQSFNLSGAVRVESLMQATALFYVEFYDETEAYVGGKFFEQPTATSAFIALEGNGVIPPTAATAAIFAVIEGTGTNGSGTLYVDDLFFKTNSLNLEVVETVPQNGEVEVDPEQLITVTFNKPVVAGAEYGDIALKQGAVVVGTNVQIEQNSLIIAPTEQLAGQAVYTLTIPKNAIQDSEGKGLADSLLLTFTTRDHSNLLRNGGFEQYTGSSGVADYWRSRVNAGVQGAFEVVSTNVSSGTKAGKISATGLNQGTLAALYQEIDVISDQGYQMGGLVRVDAINEASVVLYVDFYNENGAYIGGKFIEQASTTNGYILLQEQGIVPSNAVEAAIYVAIEGTGVNGSGTVYVDDMFYKENTIALEIVDTSPVEGELDVDPEQPIHITFNKPITAGIEYSSITLKQGEAVIDTNLQIEGNVLNIVPIETLAEQAIYILTIPSGAVQDSEGHGLANPKGLTFTTRADESGSGDTNLLLNGGFEQYTGNNGVANNWRSRISGGVQGVYEVVNTPVNSGSQAQKISASELNTGHMAGLFQEMDVIANQEFEFGGSVRIDALDQANVLLYVDFYNENGAYVGGKFIEQSVVNNGYAAWQGQGIVPASAVEAAIFVGIEGAGTNGSGVIYVDDMFLQPVEPSALEVVDTDPADGEIGAELDQPIIITFNKPVTAGTEYSGIVLKNGEIVIGTTVQIDQNDLIITPTLPLDGQSTFTLTVPNHAIQDAEGQGLVNPILITFTTRNVEDDSNLLSNGGFEQYTGSNGVANNWRSRVIGDVQDVLEVVNTPVASGTGAQLISAEGLDAGEMVALYQVVDVEEDQGFDLGASIRIDVLDQANAVFYVDFYNENGVYVGGKFIEESDVTDGYVLWQMQGVIPSGAIEAAVYVIIEGTGIDGSGTLYADDVYLTTNPVAEEQGSQMLIEQTNDVIREKSGEEASEEMNGEITDEPINEPINEPADSLNEQPLSEQFTTEGSSLSKGKYRKETFYGENVYFRLKQDRIFTVKN